MREEQAVGRADVVAAAGDGEREVAAAGGEGVEGGREAEGPVGRGGVLFVEDREEVGAEDVETEEAEVKPGSQSGHDELLFGGGGRGLFEDGVDLVERAVAADELAADGPVGGELALAGRLHGGDGGVLGDGDGDELAGAARGAVGDVEVVADEVKKRLISDEVAAAEDGVAVAAGGGLGDEAHARTEGAAGFGVGGFVAGADDDAEFLDAGAGGLLEDDLEGGFRFALLVDERLEREGALARIRGGDEGFADGHGRARGRTGEVSRGGRAASTGKAADS